MTFWGVLASGRHSIGFLARFWPHWWSQNPDLRILAQKPSFLVKNHDCWKQARVFGSGVPCRGSFFLKIWIFFDFWWIFKVLKSLDSEPGTPLERSGSKFCAKSRPRELRSIYGDPFHEDFVPAGGDDGSGPGSHTFPARCAGGGGGSRIFWRHTQPTLHSLTHS